MRKFVHGLLHGEPDSAPQQAAQYPIQQSSQPSASGPATELAQRTFSYFYSSKNEQFQARVKSDSTLGAENDFGYVVWPVTIMVHAAAECLPPDKLELSISCLQAYWNPGRHGFCAWKMFPGNEDIYYDDNAHAIQSLISAFQATGNHQHIEQAKSVLVNLILPAAQKDGGVPWHTNNQNCRNACSTGPSAVAALRICALEHNQPLFAFAQRALKWLMETLRDPEDGLIWDSLVYREDGTPDINKMKWTYNTGFAIHGFTLLYELTQDLENLRIATQLAEAAMNCEGPLFDRSIPNPGDRMYTDGSFFLHHLMDGYFALSKHALREQLSVELHKVAQFARDFMFDSTDGLYFRGSCPCTISEETTRKFNSRFNMNKSLEKNGQERDEHGNLCKTMIGNAGWARIFCLADHITQLQ